jgi:hypothetical protein
MDKLVCIFYIDFEVDTLTFFDYSKDLDANTYSNNTPKDLNYR